ncbi:MAG: histidine--tRNA ligase [Candidatus ainarchaeum sp.]|nr:histidine--tRNA ligase [Candidatus ainarchaeum sp.]
MVQVVRGMRDLIGQDALIQETIESTFVRVFSSYGYLPQYTPAVESYELFKAKGTVGEAIKDEIYYFKDKSERELALRFEFTSSLARIVSTQQIKMPYKRYQIGEVYRYDRPQAKRYRAFYQADIDILGVEGLEAELEVMFVIRDCFTALNLKPRIVFNSRKLLNDLLKKYALGKEIEAMRILDKMDKVSENDIIKMLEEKEINPEIIQVIKENDIKKISQIVGQDSVGLKEIIDFQKICKDNNLDFIKFDSTLARGFEYYTGIVFEIKLDNGPSVGGGGRFDNLVSTYGGKDTPAVGIGLGVSRIFDYLKETGLKIGLDGIFLIGLDISSLQKNSIAGELRKSIFVETDLKGMKISNAIEYAQKKGYSFVGVVGENELKENKITLKNIKTGQQEMFFLNEIKEIKLFLAK